jgi:hypothetical protein
MNFKHASRSIFGKARCAALVLGFAGIIPLAAQVTDTMWNGGNGLWTDATKWNGGGPAGSRNTIVQNGTVTLNGEANIRLLQLATDGPARATLNIVKGARLSAGNAGPSFVGTGDQATGIVVQTGGEANFDNFLVLGGSGSQNTGGTASYTIGDGKLAVGQGLRLGHNTTGNCTASFVQTGGAVRLGSVALGSARYAGMSGVRTITVSGTISGGTLSVKNDYEHGLAADRGMGQINAITTVVGSAASISVGGNLTLNQNAKNDSTMVFFLDDGGVSPIELKGGAALAGRLHVAPKGGIALVGGDTFKLIEARGITGDFAKRPDASLWTVQTGTVEGGRAVVTLGLAETGRRGAIVFSSSGMQGAVFPASPAGHVVIDRLVEGTRVELCLAAVPGQGKTIADLVSHLNTNGVHAEVISNGSYTVAVTTRVTKSSARLVWDLRDFNRGATLAGIGIAPAKAR